MVTIQRTVKILLIAISIFAGIGSAGAGGSYVLTQQQWSVPRRVETVLRMPAVMHVLAEFDKTPASQLRILYPGGDEGTLWAHELKAWLVSLGLSSRQIELRPGSGESAAIEMQVEPPISGMIKQSEVVPEQAVKQE